MAKIEHSQQYWRKVAQGWQAREGETLWRRLNDAVIQDLLVRWLAGRHFNATLKTDLFEESFSQGLGPVLSDHSSQIVGIDLAALVVCKASESHPEIAASVSDVRSLPFLDESFDLVVSPSTLDHFEHIDQLQRSLNELERILSPGGELVITLDNLDNPVVKLRNGLPSKLVVGLGLMPYVAGQTCGRRKLRVMLEDAGFEVLELTTVLHIPRLPAVVLARILDGRGPRIQKLLFRASVAFEILERTPARFLSGYFLAARARKPIVDRPDRSDA